MQKSNIHVLSNNLQVSSPLANPKVSSITPLKISRKGLREYATFDKRKEQSAAQRTSPYHRITNNQSSLHNKRDKSVQQRLLNQPSTFDLNEVASGQDSNDNQVMNLLSSFDEIMPQDLQPGKVGTIKHLPMPRSIHEKVHSKRNKLELIKDLDKNIKRMGGLGSPHVGSPEWENKMAQYKKMKDFGNAYNLVNKYGNIRADIVS